MKITGLNLNNSRWLNRTLSRDVGSNLSMMDVFSSAMSCNELPGHQGTSTAPGLLLLSRTCSALGNELPCTHRNKHKKLLWASSAAQAPANTSHLTFCHCSSLSQNLESYSLSSSCYLSLGGSDANAGHGDFRVLLVRCTRSHSECTDSLCPQACCPKPSAAMLVMQGAISGFWLCQMAPNPRCTLCGCFHFLQFL